MPQIVDKHLVRDRFRRSKGRTEPLGDVASGGDAEKTAHLRADLGRLLLRLKPRDREILWLAYVEGSSHQEIAQIIGLKTASIRPMLFRARQKLARLLRLTGLAPAARQEGER